jgi:outer membrane receptor for ferrienterochelin and colicins
MKTIYTAILLVLVGYLLQPWKNAEAQNIKGLVFEKDENGHRNPLPGVNVFWIKTTQGATTNTKGEFTIPARDIKDKRLVFSFLGYQTDTVSVDAKFLEVEMVQGDIILKTVEVEGKIGSSYISSLDPRKVQVVTSKELRKAACCNLAESFETNSSVDVMYSDALTGAKQIHMLGLSGVYSQVLSENVPLVRGLASSFGLGYIPGTWMESILISKGASSVVNGFESTTGQIMVEFKKPANTEKFFLNLFGNNNARIEANAHAAYNVGERTSTALFGHFSSFRNAFDRNNDLIMDIPENTTYNFMNRWDYTIHDRFTSHLGIKFFDERKVGGFMNFVPGDYTRDTVGINDGTKTYGIQMHTRRVEGFLKNGIMFPENPDRSVALILSGIYHTQDDMLGLNQYDASQKSFYANLLYQDRIINEHHKFISGFSFMYDNYKERYQRRDFTYLYEVAGADLDQNPDSLFTIFSYHDTLYNRDRNEVVPGAFFEYTMHLFEKLTLIAGLRADYHSKYGLFYTPRMHVRYALPKGTILRASAGKGYRTANVLSENYSIMASQRVLNFSQQLNQEDAWNFGLNITQDIHLFGREAQIDAEAYRTSFVNQVIVDLDSLPSAVFVYNLSGKSYSNIFQFQLTFEPIKNLTLLTAIRFNDVRITENGKLREKAMSNKYKGLFNASYATRFEKWKFDLTLQLNGKARIPDTQKMPLALQRSPYSPVYVQLLAQVTRKFKYFEVYLGGENLTNFTQKDPVTEYWRPYHTHFDTSMVWGPIVGATVYAGLRYSIK